ncbi:MAG: hypothetical protein SFY80_10480 [Verrucomicrobiota bacterium]|nr:hypothetical protein [Verrucomicrobiota bacterium]
MKYHSRILLVLMVNAVLVIGFRQVNQLLCAHSLYLFTDALLLIFGAFYLRAGHVVIIALITGLFLDATRPVNFGSTAAWLMLLSLGIVLWRVRLRRENSAHITGVAMLANLILFVVLAFSRYPAAIAFHTYFMRMLVDLLLSTLVIYCVTSRLVEWQYLLHYYLGEDVSNDPLSR